MNGLHLEIDLDKISDNAQHLVDRAAQRGVSVTGVTKALLGEPRVARTLIAAGVTELGDSYIENIERMQHAHVNAPMLLLRSPMISQIDRIVRSNAISVNTELDVLSALATAARTCGRIHDVMIMVELGDLRDGVMPDQIHDTVRHIRRSPNLRLCGIGTNLACRNGIAPSNENMAELSRLVSTVESKFDIEIPTVSGGNSANLEWLDTAEHPGRINNLRLGEAILLGRDPLTRHPISGLHTDAIALSAEVIESKRKPTKPWGRAGQNAFGANTNTVVQADRGEIWQTIVAVGRQNTDPDDLHSPAGVEVLGASSDHMILETTGRIAPGTNIRFEPGYSALLRAMTSPLVSKEFRQERTTRSTIAVSSRQRRRETETALASDRPPKLTVVPRSPLATATGA